MHRFYSHCQNISGDKIIIKDKEQVHHLKDVLRLKKNDEVMVFDERGNQYLCVINTVRDKVSLNIAEKQPFSKPKQSVSITVACAIPKKSRMDEIIDKLTQLGVERIIPLDTERVIIKLDTNKRLSRLERWRKIAVNSAKQSQRNTLPVLEPIQDIKAVLSRHKDFDLKLIPTLIDERKSLKEVLDKAKPKNILVLIGPEGDFTPQELALAKKQGCIPVSLGNLVLRVDTAALAIVSILNYVLK